RIKLLADMTAEQWDIFIRRWETMGEVMLFDETEELLCRAICAWAGVPLEESEVNPLTYDLTEMIDSSGAVGSRHWKGRLARRRAEEWAGDLIELVRIRRMEAMQDSAINTIAWHRDPDGELLDKQVAAVELLNVLRPSVAVARYIIFTA